MLASKELPPADLLVTLALISLAAVLWVGARVQVLRRQLRRGDAQQRGVTRLGFLHRLAAWPGTYALLGLLAAACGAVLWWSLAP